MTVGFCLQSLLESLSGPFAAFGFHFRLNLPQSLRARWFSIHRFPFVDVVVLVNGGTVHIPLWGQCQDAPGFTARIILRLICSVRRLTFLSENLAFRPDST
jgi:hypothetical protein